MTKLAQAIVQYSLFVVRHVGTARLDTLDTLVSTRSTRRTCLVVSRHDATSQVKFGLISILSALSATIIGMMCSVSECRFHAWLPLTLLPLLVVD